MKATSSKSKKRSSADDVVSSSSVLIDASHELSYFKFGWGLFLIIDYLYWGWSFEKFRSCGFIIISCLSRSWERIFLVEFAIWFKHDEVKIVIFSVKHFLSFVLFILIALRALRVWIDASIKRKSEFYSFWNSSKWLKVFVYFLFNEGISNISTHFGIWTIPILFFTWCNEIVLYLFYSLHRPVNNRFHTFTDWLILFISVKFDSS